MGRAGTTITEAQQHRLAVWMLAVGYGPLNLNIGGSEVRVNLKLDGRRGRARLASGAWPGPGWTQPSAVQWQLVDLYVPVSPLQTLKCTCPFCFPLSLPPHQRGQLPPV